MSLFPRWAFVTILTTAIVGCRSDQRMNQANAIIQEAKQLVAPDRRTAVFDVEPRLDGNSLQLTGEIQSASLKGKLIQYIKEKSTFDVVDSLTVLPEAGLGSMVYGVVNVSVASIRSKPGHPEELATQALLGTPLQVIKHQHGWFYVQTPDEYLGWLDDGFQQMDQAGYYEWVNGPKIIVTANYGVTLMTTDKNSDVVSDVVAGCILRLVGDSGKFYRVEYPDKRTAFLSKDLAQPYGSWLAKAKDTHETIAATARRFVGVPYLWGGTSPKGMDCSGFTKTVFFLNGVLLPRDASQQVAVGKSVDVQNGFDSLSPGDLLFFGSKGTADRRERVTHVGIYLGDRKYIHESEDVHINSLNKADPDFSEYRFNSFLHAKRVIGAGVNTGVRRLIELPYYRGNEQ